MSTNGSRPSGDEKKESLLPDWSKYPSPEEDIVGTKEASDLLEVERTRIGKWHKRGIMPPLVRGLSATPVWRREHILAMKPWVEANRRPTAADPANTRKSGSSRKRKQRAIA